MGKIQERIQIKKRTFLNFKKGFFIPNKIKIFLAQKRERVDKKNKIVLREIKKVALARAQKRDFSS